MGKCQSYFYGRGILSTNLKAFPDSFIVCEQIQGGTGHNGPKILQVDLKSSHPQRAPKQCLFFTEKVQVTKGLQTAVSKPWFEIDGRAEVLMR